MAKFKIHFLDYYKMILQKVSFDSRLLKREYLKAVESLGREDVSEFRNWVKANGLIPRLLQKP